MSDRRVWACLAVAGLAGITAACGPSSAGTRTTHPPSRAPSLAPSASTVPAASSPASSGVTPSGPRSSEATASDKADLFAAFIGYSKLVAKDVAGTETGTVHVAYVPSTRTSWALATFEPSATASQSALVALQDGHNIGIFTRPPGRSWTMVANGEVPFCPSQTAIPAAVQQLWGVTDAGACSAGS